MKKHNITKLDPSGPRSHEEDSLLKVFNYELSKIVKRSKRISEDASWGEILWCISPKEPTGIPEDIDGKRRYSEGIDGASASKGFMKCERKGKIYLAVNDVWLYPHEDYLDVSQYQMLQLDTNKEMSIKKIQQLQRWQYYNLWFDDNSGAFLVTITKK